MSEQLHKNVCDEQIFKSIHKKLAKDLHDFVYYKYGASFNPEDTIQDAFIKLWNNCKKVTPEKAKSFLFTIVNNTALNEAKHKKVVLKYQQIKPKSYTNENPEFELESKQYLEKFQKALNKLPEGQRTAFMLNRVEGKKHQEIADLLGVSKKAIEKRIYTALKTLRAEIKEI